MGRLTKRIIRRGERLTVFQRGKARHYHIDDDANIALTEAELTLINDELLKANATARRILDSMDVQIVQKEDIFRDRLHVVDGGMVALNRLP